MEYVYSVEGLGFRVEGLRLVGAKCTYYTGIVWGCATSKMKGPEIERYSGFGVLQSRCCNDSVRWCLPQQTPNLTDSGIPRMYVGVSFGSLTPQP